MCCVGFSRVPSESRSRHWWTIAIYSSRLATWPCLKLLATFVPFCFAIFRGCAIRVWGGEVSVRRRISANYCAGQQISLFYGPFSFDDDSKASREHSMCVSVWERELPFPIVIFEVDFVRDPHHVRVVFLCLQKLGRRSLSTLIS